MENVSRETIAKTQVDRISSNPAHGGADFEMRMTFDH